MPSAKLRSRTKAARATTKLLAAVALAILGSPASAKEREFRLFTLQQRGQEAPPYPATRYRHGGFTMMWNSTKDPTATRVFLTLGVGGSSSGDATYRPSDAGSNGSSGTYHPAGYLSFGVRMESSGPVSFGFGLEGRFGTEFEFASWGDTAGGGTKPPDQIRPWAIVSLAWRPRLPSGFRPSVGLQAGFGAGEAPYPAREWGLFAGACF